MGRKQYPDEQIALDLRQAKPLHEKMRPSDATTRDCPRLLGHVVVDVRGRELCDSFCSETYAAVVARSFDCDSRASFISRTRKPPYFGVR